MRTLVLCVIMAVSAPLAAAGGQGRVIDVEGGTFCVEAQGEARAGDPVTVWVEVPGLDGPIPVCQGKVAGMEDGYVVVRRTGGEAEPRYGDLARIGR